jgi:4-hydroxy-tetrahydrodipicolinate reductase
MGRAIEVVALERGHEIVAIVDPAAGGERVRARLDPEALAGARAAFEFTGPASAEPNVLALLQAGIAVVCGTTGWAPGEDLRRAARRAKVGAVVAPNFSVGMNLFYAAVREAARLAGASDLYDPFVVEHHHRAKLDSPSGTALKLAAIVREAAPTFAEIEIGSAQAPVSGRAIHVASIRAGHEPGTHTVGFDGVHDRITLTHAARGRGGFALGAVLAAEWVVGRAGLHGFDEVVRDLVAGGGER